MTTTRRKVAAEGIIDALPDWFTALVQLNGLIAERMGLVVTDFHCLHELNRGGPATASSLADRVGLTAGSVSRMIDRLEAADCVRRVPDPHDRRKILIEPTPEGLERVADYYAGLTVRTRENLDSLDDEQLRVLLHFVQTALDDTAAEVARLRSTAAAAE
ncbi:MarR family winged helix-turn-helix transcriptional regulator [Actinomadura sp. 9N215]|uniref:MarR family winged helix-turn-helix transcriptional regulator n=1 Tax=Actinomadura sp. 9N215 TaxID=3375150 RepID=UPI0037AA4A44